MKLLFRATFATMFSFRDLHALGRLVILCITIPFIQCKSHGLHFLSLCSFLFTYTVTYTRKCAALATGGGLSVIGALLILIQGFYTSNFHSSNTELPYGSCCRWYACLYKGLWGIFLLCTFTYRSSYLF